MFVNSVFISIDNESIKSGLYFESSIPIGYGIGSSGALVAALYEKYCSEKVFLENNL